MVAGPLPENAQHLQWPSFELTAMVAKIACIIFLIEALIMLVLSQVDIRDFGVYVDVLDATTLALVASPIIYLSVTWPCADAAREANTKLTQQLEESRLLLEQNEKLRVSLQQTSESSAEIHERMLQKIGAELHDGPAQLLTYTLLQLDQLTPIVELAHENNIDVDLGKLHGVLTDAMREVRAISTGLSLPELAAASID